MLPDRLKEIETDFLVFIQLRKKFNPVNSPEIEKHFNITGSEVRQLIKELRRQGYGIANTLKTEDGKIKKIYFYTEKWDDMKGTVEDIEGRAKDELYTCSCIRKRFGQYDEPTLY